MKHIEYKKNKSFQKLGFTSVLLIVFLFSTSLLWAVDVDDEEIKGSDSFFQERIVGTESLIISQSFTSNSIKQGKKRQFFFEGEFNNSILSSTSRNLLYEPFSSVNPPIFRAGGNEGGGDPSKLPIKNGLVVLIVLVLGYTILGKINRFKVRNNL